MTVSSIILGFQPGNRVIIDDASKLQDLSTKIAAIVEEKDLARVDAAILERADRLLARTQGFRSYFIFESTKRKIYESYNQLFEIRIALRKDKDEQAALKAIQMLTTESVGQAAINLNISSSFEKFPKLNNEIQKAARNRLRELEPGWFDDPKDHVFDDSLKRKINVILNGYCVDERNSLKSENCKKPIKDCHYEWNLNLAIIREILKQTNLTPSDRKTLMMLALNAYAKAAPLDYKSINNLGLQTTPLFRDDYVYFRCSDNQLMSDHEGTAVQNKEHVKKAFHQAGYEVVTINTIKDLEPYLQRPDKKAQIIIDFTDLPVDKMDDLCDNVKIYPNIQLIAFRKKGEIYKLINPRAFNPSRITLNSDLRQVLNAGYYPTPELMRSALLQYKSLDEALETIGCNQVYLKDGINDFLKDCDINSFDDFLKKPELQALVNLSTDTNYPYLQVLPKATVALLRGFKDLDQKFEKKNLFLLLKVSCFRMHKAIQSINSKPNDFINVRNQLEIIHQEIQMILAVTEPYKETDFNQALISRLTNKNVLPDLGREVIPRAYLQHSAMRCISNIIQAVAAQKGESNLNIVKLKDVYYEVGYIKTKGNLFELNGDESRDDKELKFNKQLPEKTKLDLFICEFHHNISSTRKKYQPEQILNYIKKMNTKGLLSDKFTILIDATLDDEDSNEIQQLLKDDFIKEKIQNGTLSIALVSSTQKFDMVSLDNFYGGKIITLNNYQAFQAFNLYLCHPDNQVRGLCYQGLTHLHTHAGEEINRYKRLIKNNAKKFYNKLNLPITSFITVADMKEDNELPYIDIKMPYNQRSIKFFKNFVEYCNNNKLPFTQRNSYGFSNTNGRIWEGIEGQMVFRLTIGLEKEEDLNRYVAYFNNSLNYILFN